MKLNTDIYRRNIRKDQRENESDPSPCIWRGLIIDTSIPDTKTYPHRGVVEVRDGQFELHIWNNYPTDLGMWKIIVYNMQYDHVEDINRADVWPPAAFSYVPYGSNIVKIAYFDGDSVAYGSTGQNSIMHHKVIVKLPTLTLCNSDLCFIVAPCFAFEHYNMHLEGLFTCRMKNN